ncbi:MAG TPA: class I SAM-dependent methyltransferase [Dongiaceae bacterium]|nr:class I SAM-dependent methyltransferase [Dongiaceae bacterium]
MRVVEIGCGDNAGPFFKNATEHFAVDISPLRVQNAVDNEPRFTPMVADATNLDGIDDSSVHVLLARNVFGDPFLGLERGLALDLSFTQREDDESRKAKLDVVRRKLAVVAEAARILTTGGQLLVVEQYTPEYAEEFIDQVNDGTLLRPASLAPFEQVELSDVTPKDYSRRHFNATTWVSTAVNHK